jgi:energy-coupling factor transporter transmembrane protein EcfT
MGAFVALVSSIDPWWLLAAFLILLIIEMALDQPGIPLILGLASLKLAIAKFYGADGYLAFWLIPMFLGTSFFSQRFISRKLTKSPDDPFEQEPIVGQRGRIKVIEAVNESDKVFYDYQNRQENQVVDGPITVRIVLDDGRTFKVSNGDGLPDGTYATIKMHTSNGIVTVEVTE